jgi:hypothetical protein
MFPDLGQLINSIITGLAPLATIITGLAPLATIITGPAPLATILELACRERC